MAKSSSNLANWLAVPSETTSTVSPAAIFFSSALRTFSCTVASIKGARSGLKRMKRGR